MFEFFIALFGGTYYGGKYIGERKKTNAYEKTAETISACRNRLREHICISYQNERDIKDYILSGDHFEDICNYFENDFKFVFGSNWRELLCIPPNPPVLDPKLYKRDAYSFLIPANHIYWVYRLILSSYGKVDNDMLTSGYSIGGLKDRDMCMKFAQCIERRLLESGVKGVRFVIEHRSDGDIIAIESLCYSPSATKALTDR